MEKIRDKYVYTIKEIRWRNIFIGVLLVLIGFTVGVFGTVAKINKQLDTNIKINLLAIPKVGRM